MDFLKTLMLYITLLTTMSVQEGPLPQDAPTPTAAPTTVATFAPFSTEVPTATPSPRPEPTPQITPNSRYETLRFNDRGDEVRKLQRRLIELGYMPKGSADGAYGYQTYNAVRDFQRANGLEADGVAGPATLTQLYQNPDVRPMMTATPVPTATPTPTIEPIPTPKPVTPAPETPTPTPTLAPTATIVPPVNEVPVLTDVTAAPTTSAATAPLTLTPVTDALIISGNTGKALVITQLVDGVAVPLQPQLWLDAAGEPYMMLRDLVDCYEGWTLSGSAAEGRFQLYAAGYDVQLLMAGDSVRVTVDGRSINVDADDACVRNGVLYVSGTFLSKALDANVIYDAQETSLVLFIRDKSMNDATD